MQPKDRLRSISHAQLHPVPVVLNTHAFDPEGVHKHTDISFAFAAHAAPALMPEHGESSDIRWVSSHQLAELNSTEIFENVREIGQYVLNHIFTKWERSSDMQS